MFPPLGINLPYRLIHLANIPGGSYQAIKDALDSAFAPHFQALEWAPHMIMSTTIITTRCSAMATPGPENPNFESSPQIVKVLDQPVLVAWAGARYPCSICLTTEHTYAQCDQNPKNKKNPKNKDTKSYAEVTSSSSKTKQPDSSTSSSSSNPDPAPSKLPDTSTAIPIEDSTNPMLIDHSDESTDRSTEAVDTSKSSSQSTRIPPRSATPTISSVSKQSLGSPGSIPPSP